MALNIVDIENGKDIQAAIEAMEIKVEFIETTKGPSVIKHHFFIINPLDFTKLKRKSTIEALSAFTKHKATLEESDIGHFAIAYARENRESREFNVYGTGLQPAQLVLGVNQENEPIMRSLDDLPHLLIAGTTGSGKSVCLNSLIMQLIVNSTPDKITLCMVDTKKVELGLYKKSKHLSAFADSFAMAKDLLEAVSSEMDMRYKLMEQYKMRKYDGAHIVVIIDELADLMLGSKDAVEPLIVRLAQMGRAANIHLILATQSPRVSVITGLILANLPTRICLTMSAARESVLCLGHKGAEQLNGKGDALLKLNGESEEVRIQTLNISTDYIVNYLNK